MVRQLVCLAVLGISAALAAESPDFNGKWHLDASKSNGSQYSPLLVIALKEGQIHVQELSQANEPVLDYQCGTAGKECDIQDLGKPAKISLWYMGPALVMLETGRNGEEVVKRKIQLASDGGLEMEFQRIVPPGDTDKLYFSKK